MRAHARTGRQPLERAKLAGHLVEQPLTGGAEFVISPRRPALLLRDAGVLPPRDEASLGFEPGERGVDRAAGKARYIDDVEAVPVSAGNGFQHGEGCVSRASRHADSRLSI